MNKIIKQPIFWLGVSGLVFAYYVTQNDSQGVNNLLTITAIGGGAALIILAVKKTA